MTSSKAINWNSLAMLWSARALIDGLPIDQQERVQAAERELRDILERYGREGKWAFAVVGMEASLER